VARIVILGAGLTGLSTAYHLEQAGCTDYLLFEKETTPGGLCRSVTSHGFTFDYTGHLLHSNDATTRPLVDLCVGKDNLATATRSAWIESSGIQTPYPFQMYLHGRSPEVIAECIEGFVTRAQTRRQPHMFPEWVESAFGAGFGKHFFYPYQRKIFSYPPRKLTATWTGRFVPKTDLSTIIRGALTPQTADNIGYNSTFLYPKSGGINALITGLVKQISRPVLTGFCVTAIDTTRKIVTFANGHQEHYEQLISTLPLDNLLTMLDGTHTQKLQSAASNLLCTSVLNINMGVNNSDVHNSNTSGSKTTNFNYTNSEMSTSGANHHKVFGQGATSNALPNASWIYYPDANSPWYRIGFPHSFAASACPAGTQSLYAELSYLNTSKQKVARLDAYKKNINNTDLSRVHTPHVTRAITQAETKILEHFNLSSEAVIARAPLMLDHAYVIYNTWRDTHIPQILHRLTADYAIHSIGRYGAWKYASMQEALVDGKTTAHAVTNTFIPAQLSLQNSRRRYEAPSTTIKPTTPHQITPPHATTPNNPTTPQSPLTLNNTESRSTIPLSQISLNHTETHSKTIKPTTTLSHASKHPIVPIQHNGDEHEA
jgi:protoporphyrinogen oxidase